MKYFKAIYGYDSENYVELNETELDKAIYLHLTAKKGLLTGGSISGDRVIAVQPDFHRAMGWNRGYSLGPDDYAELNGKGIYKSYNILLEDTKARVHHLIETGQEHLIGKPMDNTHTETKRLN